MDPRRPVPEDGPAGRADGVPVLDGVIQRLFALGLTVQRVSLAPGGDDQAATLRGVVAGIDTTIGEVRRHMTADAAHGPATCPPPAGGSAR